MSNHTPGPWKMPKKPEQELSAQGGVPLLAYSKRHDADCAFLTIRGENVLNDAALIAAAPELLEELKSTMSQLIKYGALRIGSKKHETLVSLIAKAEGR